MARKKRSLIKRLILWLAGSLLLLLLSLYLLGIFFLSPLLKVALEKYGPEALGAEVEVGEVSVQLLRGVAKVDGLIVGNPEGYAEPIGMDASQLEIHMKLLSLLSDTVVIREIVIREPVVTYEKRKGVTNLEQLQRNAMAWADSLSSKEDDGKPPKKVIIERLLITDGVLRVKLPHLPAVPVKLSDIERINIGGNKPEGQNFGQATLEVLEPLRENSAELVENAGGTIQNAGEAALEAGKNTGLKVLDFGGKALDAAGDAVGDLLGN